jgi:prophage regulatory protein
MVRFMRLREVMAITGIAKSQIYKLVAEGRFPQQAKVGPRMSRWVEPEVEAWQRERLEERQKAA